MKLLVDMNLSPKWVQVLRNAGWDAIHWSSTGKPTATDLEVMTYASEQEYVVLTHDLDFGAILATTHGEKPSVVQLRTDEIDQSVLGPRVLAILEHMKAELQSGALVTIDQERTRVRLLPFARK